MGIGFNSKLVRLKAKVLADEVCARASFNSKLVRLKVPITASLDFRFSMFQFQTGAIKSDGDFADGVHYIHSFNSKLVRLKVFYILSHYQSFR